MRHRTATGGWWARAYCVAAGLGDTSTGLLLMVSPFFTLGLMGISRHPVEPVYLRFVGAFVAAVGLSYLFPFLYRDRERAGSTLAAVLEVTALVRLVVALFVAWALATGALSAAWVSVMATDLTLAIVQLVMVRRRVLHPGHPTRMEKR